MIIQISEEYSIVLRCCCFDNQPEMQDFYISIYKNHLYLSRNGNEEMKIHLDEKRGRPLFTEEREGDFDKITKNVPLKKTVILIKLEKK